MFYLVIFIFIVAIFTYIVSGIFYAANRYVPNMTLGEIGEMVFIGPVRIVVDMIATKRKK